MVPILSYNVRCVIVCQNFTCHYLHYMYLQNQRSYLINNFKAAWKANSVHDRARRLLNYDRLSCKQWHCRPSLDILNISCSIVLTELFMQKTLFFLIIILLGFLYVWNIIFIYLFIRSSGHWAKALWLCAMTKYLCVFSNWSGVP